MLEIDLSTQRRRSENPDILTVDVADLLEIKAATILYDAIDGSRLSLYHRAQDARDGGLMSLAETTITIVTQILEGDLVPTSDSADVRTCTGCGCTDAFACEVICSWENDVICSWCAAIERGTAFK